MKVNHSVFGLTFLVSSRGISSTRLAQPNRSIPSLLHTKTHITFNPPILMNWKTRTLSSILKQFNPYQHQQIRTVSKVRLKWIKNKGLDHIIDLHTDLKAASLIQTAIHHSPTQFLTSKSLAQSQKILNLTIPTLRFVRRYPNLFQEFPHPKYPSLPCFRLTNLAQFLINQEEQVQQNNQMGLVEKLCKLLMMTKNQSLPFQAIHPLKWDLGLPHDFDKAIVLNHPDMFRIQVGSNGSRSLELVKRVDEYAVSKLEKAGTADDAKVRRGQNELRFSMAFPKGYGGQKKVKAWMDEFQNLPYISPYEDSSAIDPNSDLMEKRVVGVLHEFLSLTVYKKTKRNNLRSLREALNLPHRFTRIFTRYPGIFYLSLKCKTTTVTLKEGYRRGKLVNPCALARYREKFAYVMRTGLIYRSKGAELLMPQLDELVDREEDRREEEESEDEEEVEMSEGCFEGESSELEESDED